MDLDDQAQVKKLADQYGRDQLVVILGLPDADSAQVVGETVTTGDPTYAGPLAGVPLGLPVFHILESEVKEQVNPKVFDEQVGLMEMVLEKEEIVERVRQVRQQSTTTSD